MAGLVDAFEERGLRAFGPTAAAARLEGSKAWAKELCERYGIPAARSRTFSDAPLAEAALEELEPPYVVKADGLAAGKGVTIARSRDEAVAAIRAGLVDRVFGEAGTQLLLEEHLTGREVSAFALTDGREALPLAAAQDYKRVGDGDVGPNTGGMGAYSPVPWADGDLWSRIVDEILVPTVRAMAEEGVPYRGVLYAGLMVTDEGPKVLEYNCRFGDPETQVVMPRLGSEPAALLAACADGDLAGRSARLRPEACVTVVLASRGYPGAYQTGVPIDGLEGAAEVDGATIFHAGTARRAGRVVTAGGRVLAVSGLAATIEEAAERAYEAAARISFEGAQYRRDIAAGVS